MLLIFSLAFLLLAQGRTGIDFSIPLSSSTLQSYLPTPKTQKNFLIAHAQFFNNTFNTPIVNTLKTAWRLGVADISVYFYPCLPDAPYAMGTLASSNISVCSNPYTQLDTFLNTLSLHGMDFFDTSVYDMAIYADMLNDVYAFPSVWNTTNPKVLLSTLYVNVEDITPNQFFSTNHTENIVFLQNFVTYARSLGIDVGIYTTVLDYVNIMTHTHTQHTRTYTYPTSQGMTYTNPLASTKLWTPRYDQQNDFSFYTSFANWTAPHVKQITGGAKDMRRVGNARVCLDYKV
ncbi:hypothetical protein EON63_01035 [archaeon]|nr:MAG: hypothetical protein EON63_01035 [archaeon]